jgi:hypothetical protein
MTQIGANVAGTMPGNPNAGTVMAQPQAAVTQPKTERKEPTVVSAPSGAPQVAGVIWKNYEVNANKKMVGSVVVPEFDEVNVQAGMTQIRDMDAYWKSLGYKDWMEACVSLVNTQHGTNLRNELRSANSGKLNAAQVEAEALKMIPQEELMAALKDPMKFIELKNRAIKQVKARYAQAEAAAGGTDAQEAADVQG